MIEAFKFWDEQLFLWLNGYHWEWLDPIAFQLTKTVTWIPLFAFLVYKIYQKNPKNSWWVFVGVALTILLADQATSAWMKPFFERLRPCHDTRWDAVIFNYKHCGGLYGFASSHAANTFGIALFLNLKLKGKLHSLGWLFLYAGVVSYTRIYLGVHYPLDVLIGALVGCLAAWISWLMIIFAKKQILGKSLT